MEVMELVGTNDYERHESRDLIHEIKLLLSRNWRVQVGWRSREENVYADYFAKKALHLGPGLHLLTRDEAIAMLASEGIT